MVTGMAYVSCSTYAQASAESYALRECCESGGGYWGWESIAGVSSNNVAMSSGILLTWQCDAGFLWPSKPERGMLQRSMACLG